jgi:hypothetical protein
VRLLGALAEALTLHAAVEEEHLYPPCSRAGSGQAVGPPPAWTSASARWSRVLELKRSDPKLEGKVAEWGTPPRAPGQRGASISPRTRGPLRRSSSSTWARP